MKKAAAQKADFRISEAVVEAEFLQQLASSWHIAVADDSLPPGYADVATTQYPVRKSLNTVLLTRELGAAVNRLNPQVEMDGRIRAVDRLRNLKEINDSKRMREAWRLLRGGWTYEDSEGRNHQMRYIDWNNPDQNEFLAVNQYTVVGIKNKRPDVVLFVNGIPIGIAELKNPHEEVADLLSAWNQVETYRAEIPRLFDYLQFSIISDGMDTRMGSTTAPWEHMKPWRTTDGKTASQAGRTDADDRRKFCPLDIPAAFLCNHQAFLEWLHDFFIHVALKTQDYAKIAGAYHQFMAGRKAHQRAKREKVPHGTGQGGVVWHTQGSGKSFTMVFYARRILEDPELENPTVLVVTDRIDLDDQLRSDFEDAQDELKYSPKSIEDADDLRKHLSEKTGGGLIFTTIQKFQPDDDGQYPVLSERDNIFIITDEAHRSQYGLKEHLRGGKRKLGYAGYMRQAFPNATFTAFTGTPVQKGERDTRVVFGDDVDVFDVVDSVRDGITVPIYYEARRAKLKLEGIDELDEQFEQVFESDEIIDEAKERAKTKWAAMEKIVGSQPRLEQVAADFVKHYETRRESIDGKAMFVCMSRDICARLYDEIGKLRPDWAHDDDDKGNVKVVFTGQSSDPAHLQPHVRNRRQMRELAERFKDPQDPFRIVIVRDMWLTGFDAPCLEALYVDKPMRGHTLMQAIARVNRVFEEKSGGLVVDYVGINHEIKRGFQRFTKSNKRQGGFDEIQALNVFDTCLRDAEAFLQDYAWHGYDTRDYKEYMATLTGAIEHILAQDSRVKTRFLKAAQRLVKAHTLVAHTDRGQEARSKVAFIQGMKAQMVKHTVTIDAQRQYRDQALRKLINEALTVEGEVESLFEGLERPNIALINEDFASKAEQSETPNLYAQALMKLLNDQIRITGERNQVLSRRFAEMLQAQVERYEARIMNAKELIAALADLSKRLQGELDKGKKLELTDDEFAFYNALATAELSELQGDDYLIEMAKELVVVVKKTADVDWSKFRNSRAKLRVAVRKVLKHYKYPPEHEKAAIAAIMTQAEQTATHVSPRA